MATESRRYKITGGEVANKIIRKAARNPHCSVEDAGAFVNERSRDLRTEWYSQSVVGEIRILAVCFSRMRKIQKGSSAACSQLAAIMKFRFHNSGLRTGANAGSAAVCPGKWIVLLLFCAVFCFGTRGTGLSAHRVGSIRARCLEATHFAIADFDGDNRPDLATVETGLIGASHARYWIGFRMSAGARQTIGVNAPVGGLEIVSRDVNGDNIVDLVVSAAWLKSPVAVLVNDGHGNFTIRDPAAFSSGADQSEPDARIRRVDRIRTQQS